MSANIPTQDIIKEEFNWEVPVELVPIPSEGKIYPSDSPLHGRKSLEITAMTAKEEDILASRALIQQGTVISHLIRSCVSDKDIDPGMMILGDRNALMVSIRVTGYGSSYAAESTCPECSTKSKQDYSLTDLEIKRLSIKPVQKGANLFEYTLPVSGKVVNFKFLTGDDERERSIAAERKKKILTGLSAETSITSRLEQIVVSVDGVRDRNKVNQFVRSMPALDSRSLRKYVDENEPGIDMSVWMNCHHCGADSRVGLPIGANFFWPE